jgi:Protein of unknown function (DUF4239)
MSNWVVDLPVVWLVVVVFAATYLVTAGIYFGVEALAAGGRAQALRGVSPGMLPPLGIIFALLAAFLASAVWNDTDRAQEAVNREASSLRTAVLLADALPAAARARERSLVRRHITEAVTTEWPAMERQDETLTVIPAALAGALELALRLTPRNEGQRVVQRELVSELEDALDARRQRVIVSESSVNWVKWAGVIVLAMLTLLAIGFVHVENRATTAIAMGVFASAVAVSLVMIAAQDRPFSGPLRVKPTVLEQVLPEAARSR